MEIHQEIKCGKRVIKCPVKKCKNKILTSDLYCKDHKDCIQKAVTYYNETRLKNEELLKHQTSEMESHKIIIDKLYQKIYKQESTIAEQKVELESQTKFRKN